MTLTLEDILSTAEEAARGRTASRPDDYDDAVQEGMIAAWTALERHPDKSDNYYRSAARRGILGFVTDEHRPTGAPSRRGGGRKQNDVEITGIAGWDAPIIEPGEPDYAVREIVAELDESDREIVFMKFWLDMTWDQIAEAVGKHRSTIHRRWERHIAPSLVEGLSEL